MMSKRVLREVAKYVQQNRGTIGVVSVAFAQCDELQSLISEDEHPQLSLTVAHDRILSAIASELEIL